MRRRLIRRILLDQLPAHRQIEHEPSQPRDCVRRVRDALVVRQQAPVRKVARVHRASASARIAFSRSRSSAVSASAASRSARSVSGSP